MPGAEKDRVRELENLMLKVNEIALMVSRGEEIPEGAVAACQQYAQRFPTAFKKMVEMNRRFLRFSLVPPNCS